MKERVQSLAAAKIGRADADKQHNQKDKKEGFTASSKDDMYVYMLKLSQQSSGQTNTWIKMNLQN